MADAPGLLDQFTQNYDPQMLGIGLLANAGNRQGITGQSLANALLMGRQARLDQAQQRATQALATRKQQIDMAKEGLYDTPTGIAKRGFINTPTGAVLQQNDIPGQDLSVKPVYTPPEKPDKTKYAPVGQPIQQPDGSYIQSVYNVADPTDIQHITVGAPAKGKGAMTTTPEQAAMHQALQSQAMEDVARYFPVTDKQGNRVDWRQYDPSQHTVGEVSPAATGPLAGHLPNAMVGQRATDLRAYLNKLGSQSFLDALISSKQQGATFGALSDTEGKLLREAQSVVANPDVSPQVRMKALREMNDLAEQFAAKQVGAPSTASGTVPQKTRTTSTGVTWSMP